ncbi:PTS glucose transporter subunit IIBC [Clostridium botulinum]|uniref:PTS glucose transporter subunit IIBC n=2 Tax=Clostridium TaxID=1485 RepID=A0AAU8YSG4_CLOBO|nr:PTS glucose transporter subunit IIBC [Clostridium botulinum]NFG01843.1 PTS glucose transporter subunit IIBC [Clostridium sporogenes]
MGVTMMKEKILNQLQNFSKGMFVPVLILPIAGIIIAIGNILTNAKLAEYLPFLKNGMVFGLGKMLSGSLVSILTNLGIIFCVGLAVGLSKKKKAEAGFTSLLVFLVFINAMNIFLELNNRLAPQDALRGSGQTMVLGVQVLDMGVFLGIILGIVVAYIHNRFCEKEFDGAFQIYGGSRLVFIILIPITVFLAIILSYVWPSVQYLISSLGNFITGAGNFGVFTYGTLERLLIPTGLHHLVYTPFLYSPLGGVAEIGGKVFEGARNIYFAEMADPNIAKLSASVIWDARGLSKMFGLIGACLAMYHTALPENKSKIKAILIPAAVTSILAGVTEPIEFSFMFVAPILFVIHAVLSGLGMVVLNILGVTAIGPNGLIDFLLYNIPLGVTKTGWPMFILVGLGQFVIYYVIFRFLIVKFKLKTPGRQEDGNTKLYTKKDYKEKSKASTNSGNSSIASVVVEGLGGKDNILKVDNCYTRLRLVVKDSSLVNEQLLKNETAANGVIIKGENVQVVYGLKVTSVRKNVDEYLGIESN